MNAEPLAFLAVQLERGKPTGKATYYDCRKCGGQMMVENVTHCPNTIHVMCQSCKHWVDLVFNRTRVCLL